MFKKSIKIFSLLLLSTAIFSIPFFIDKFKKPVLSQDYYYEITQQVNFPKVDGVIYTMDLSDDGSILYVGGEFMEIGDIGGTGGTYARFNIAAINMSDYSILDFAPRVTGPIYALDVSGNYIYIGGSYNFINEVYVGEFARVSSEGVLDESICVPNIHTNYPPETVYDISITNDYIYVGGSFNEITDLNTPVYGLVRLNKSDCSWDSEWIPELDGTVYDIEIYNGSMYIGGSFENVNGTYTGEFAKLNSDGSLNTSCVPNIHTYEEIVATVYDISITADYIYVGGSFNRVVNSSNNVSGLVRLENSTSCQWDNSWVPEVQEYDYPNIRTVYTISPVGDDVFVGGSFDRIGGLEGSEFALLNGETGRASQYWNPYIYVYDPPVSSTVYSSIVTSNKLLVGGSFNTVDDVVNYLGYGLAYFTYTSELVPNIEIDSIEDLDNVRNNLYVNYTLTRDLDFEDCASYDDCGNMLDYTQGSGWEPIGYYDDYEDIRYSYEGVFDGQGYSISNLYISSSEGENVGLFGINSGTIKDVILESVDILGDDNVGALVGYNHGNILNCSSSGDVSGESSTGGLVGNLGRGNIKYSYSTGSVISLNVMGGLVGAMSYPANIIDSYSESSVSGGDVVGGLVGYNNNATITNSYSVGPVSGGYAFGGLIGSNDGGNVYDSYWDTVTSTVETSEGGAGLTTLQMKSLLSFDDWDIVEMNSFNPSDPSIWYISDGNDYPRLSWEYSAPEIETVSSTSITYNGATINGSLTSMDGETSVEVFFQYKTGTQEWSTSPEISKTTTGSFSYTLEGLTPSTLYQYRTVVTWREVGTVYGDTKSFSTLALPPLPTVFGPVVSNIEDIQNPSNTESPLVLTRTGTGSITFPSGLNLEESYDQLTELDENLIIVYESSLNRFRAYVDSDGASFLATHGATIRFFNVSNQLGVNGLTSSNFKTLLKVTVKDNSNNIIVDTASYFNWNDATYDESTDILTMPVNHFSEYVLGVNTGVLPATGMSSLTMLIPLGLFIMGIGVIVVSNRKFKNVK